MFENTDRIYYGKNQLMDVICQLRFPEILSIGTNVPAAFQDEIRVVFPRYSSKKERQAPKVVGTPGKFSLEEQQEVINYQFATADGAWRVNLTSGFISLSCARYENWEKFAKMLDKPLAAFIRIYQPAFFERVGLRFINAFSRKALGLEGVPFRDLIQPAYLGVLGEDDVNETATNRSTVDCEMAIPGGCRAKIHAGLGMTKRANTQDKEIKFILDNDLYMLGNIPIQHSAGAMQTLHLQADTLFENALTEQLRNAMEPYARDV